MKKVFPIWGLSLLFLMIGVVSCTNLKHVNRFSTSSLDGLQKFEEIEYGFKHHCLNNCRENAFHNLDLRAANCDCKMDQKADQATLKIYRAIKGYLDGLGKLSDNELTEYKLNALNEALTEGEFGGLRLEKKEVEAHSRVVGLLLRAFTDGYRKDKLKTYVREANAPLQVLLDYLNLNLAQNLDGKLRVQKQRLENRYLDLVRESDLSDYERLKAVEEYYQKLDDLSQKQEAIAAYTKALKKIAEGHQKLNDQIDQVTAVEIKDALVHYGSEIQDIISEFNKIKE
ncbi:hypothetical protein WIW50_16040 [Flavobacteriaceae bacterium 3-367]